MKNYLKIYSPFFLFLGVFFASYFVLTIIYQLYLNSFEIYTTDLITKMVASNVQQLAELVAAPISVTQNKPEAFIRLYYNNFCVATIIEGCNAVSVIILFVSFVLSFSTKLKTTLFFIIFGIIILYALNVVRITFLAPLLYYFPEQASFWHGIVFPLFIYGVVFLLWLIWVQHFFKNNSK